MKNCVLCGEQTIEFYTFSAEYVCLDCLDIYNDDSEKIEHAIEESKRSGYLHSLSSTNTSCVDTKLGGSCGFCIDARVSTPTYNKTKKLSELSVDINKFIHDRVKDCPHDIGFELVEHIQKLLNERE